MAAAVMPMVIGKMKLADEATELAEIGDTERAQTLTAASRRLDSTTVLANFEWPWESPVWPYTNHAFGYIDTNSLEGNLMAVVDPGMIPPDPTLRNQSVRLTLDRLHVEDYPGSGEHSVLFDFYAKHQTNAGVEDVRFSQVYRAREGSGAAVRGYPVFVGLNVGEHGLQLRCYTVNVENKDDKKILSILDSNVFKSGLQLLSTVNPVMPIVSEFATGLTRVFASRNSNVPVQDFFLGLDFGDAPAGARLTQGSYVAVQVPDEGLNWNDYKFDRSSGLIVRTAGGGHLKLNHVVFSIARM